MGMRHHPCCGVLIPLGKILPLLPEDARRNVESWVLDWRVEEAMNLIIDYLPELAPGWIYEPKEEDYLAPDLSLSEVYVALPLEDVFRMELKPEMKRLQEAGVDFSVSAYAPWG